MYLFWASGLAGAQLLQFYFSLSQHLRGFDLHSSNDLAALNSLFLEVNKLRVIAFQIYSSRGSYYADQGLMVTDLDYKFNKVRLPSLKLLNIWKLR